MQDPGSGEESGHSERGSRGDEHRRSPTPFYPLLTDDLHGDRSLNASWGVEVPHTMQEGSSIPQQGSRRLETILELEATSSQGGTSTVPGPMKPGSMKSEPSADWPANPVPRNVAVETQQGATVPSPADLVLLGIGPGGEEKGDTSVDGDSGCASEVPGVRAKSPVPRSQLKKINVTLPSDGFVWLKYGEKQLVHPNRTRAYFKCAQSRVCKCPAKKQVDLEADPAQDKGHKVPVTVYLQDHNHAPDPANEGEQHICPISVPEPTPLPETRGSTGAVGPPGLEVHAVSVRGVREAGRSTSQESRDLLDQYRSSLAEHSRNRAVQRSMSHGQVDVNSLASYHRQQQQHVEGRHVEILQASTCPPLSEPHAQTMQVCPATGSHQAGTEQEATLCTAGSAARRSVSLPEGFAMQNRPVLLPQEALVRRFFASLSGPAEGQNWSPAVAASGSSGSGTMMTTHSSEKPLERFSGTSWTPPGPGVGEGLNSGGMVGRKRELDKMSGKHERVPKKSRRSASDSVLEHSSTTHSGSTQGEEGASHRVRPASESSSWLMEGGSVGPRGALKAESQAEVTSPARRREGKTEEERVVLKGRGRLSRGTTKFIISGSTLVRQEPVDETQMVETQGDSLRASWLRAVQPGQEQNTEASGGSAQNLAGMDLGLKSSTASLLGDPCFIPKYETTAGQDVQMQLGIREEHLGDEGHDVGWQPLETNLYETAATPPSENWAQLGFSAVPPINEARAAASFGTVPLPNCSFSSALRHVSLTTKPVLDELAFALWTVLPSHCSSKVTRFSETMSSAPACTVGASGGQTSSMAEGGIVEALLQELQVQQQQRIGEMTRQPQVAGELQDTHAQVLVEDRLSIEKNPSGATGTSEQGGVVRAVSGAKMKGPHEEALYESPQEGLYTGYHPQTLYCVSERGGAVVPARADDGGQGAAIDPLSFLGGGDTLRTRDVLEDPFMDLVD